ncbi:MAG: type II secretion system F family protein [Clostridia bacterium]|nr:type II secretion system F family protein [Clostridia bacterium]
MKHKKLTDGALSMLCLELALFLHAGGDIGNSLTVIAQEEKELSDCLTEMAEHVFTGLPLSDAAEKTGQFPQEMTAMLKIGEKTGRLEESLNALADYYTFRENTARRIRSAVLYPCTLLFVMLGVIAVLLWKVVPVFDEVYASFGGDLQLPGVIFSAALPVLLAVVGLAAAGALVLFMSPGCRDWLNVRLNRTKLAGKLHTAHFARALYMASASGLTAEEAVETAGLLFENYMESAEKCRDCLSRIRAGESLADAAEKTGLLPGSECRLLGLAAMSGAAERAALEIARRLEKDADDALERAVSRIEPVLVLISSLLIGGVLLGVMLPMTGLMNLIG